MVQINTPAEEDDVWGMVEGRSIPGLSFSREEPVGSGDYISLPLGTSYTGTTTESLQRRQATEFGGDRAPKFYPDGKPIYDIVATLATDYAEPDNSEDDGTRRLYFTGQMRRALQDEVRAKSIKRFGIGTRITVELVGFKSNPKGKPTKQFNVTLAPTEYIPVDQQQTQEALQESFPQSAPAAPEPVIQAVPAVDPVAAALALLGAKEIVPAIIVTAEQVAMVHMLMKAGIDHDTAITAVATKERPGDEAFKKALDTEIPF